MLNQIEIEGSVAGFSHEELAFIEKKLSNSPADVKIKQLILQKKNRDLMEKRLKDIEARLAEVED